MLFFFVFVIEESLISTCVDRSLGMGTGPVRERVQYCAFEMTGGRGVVRVSGKDKDKSRIYVTLYFGND